jgi:hypothetical protein
VLIENLRKNGATAAEIAFMFADFDATRSTRRVELNAMTSPQFIAFVERKLKEHRIGKVVPDEKLLAEMYAGLKRGQRLAEALQQAVEDLQDEDEEDGEVGAEDFRAPKDLPRRIRVLLKQRRTLRWDAALAEIVEERELKEKNKSPASGRRGRINPDRRGKRSMRHEQSPRCDGWHKQPGPVTGDTAEKKTSGHVAEARGTVARREGKNASRR